MIGQTSARPVVEVAITGGSVLDGSGAPGRPFDVLVRDGRILDLVPTGQTTYDAAAGEVLDAAGLVVAPGFIDLHSHADFTLPAQTSAETSLAQGVTTVVTGNCGWSPFPYRGGAALPRATANLGSDLDWSWSDAAGYADVVRSSRPGVNVVLQTGHAAIRMAAMEGAERRPPTTEEFRMMEALVDETADHGVLGFSTGLIYAPGSFAASEEVEALVRRAAARDMLYSTHIRNEAADVLAAVAEAITAARNAHARLEISHLKAMGPAHHGLVEDAMALIDQAHADGLDVACDVYPYTASSTTLTSRLPDWAMDGGPAQLLERLSRAETREQVRAELAARFGVDVDPAGVILVDGTDEVVGASLVDLGEKWGVDPAEAALRALEVADGTVGIVNHAMAERDVESVLRFPRTSVASDGWVMTVAGQDRPHPRSFGTFARVLGRYVRERGVLGLEEAIHRMTGLPASRLRLRDRGRLVPGAVADVVVLDPDRVADLATYADPRQLAVGVEHVLIGGDAALRDGAVTPSRHGTVLTA